MYTIHKYLINFKIGKQTISLPKGAKILSVQQQSEYFFLWAVVDPQANMKPRTLYIFPTGGTDIGVLPDMLGHISTVQVSGFVWHFFEVPSERISELKNDDDE